jgi:hypothetical protein
LPILIYREELRFPPEELIGKLRGYVSPSKWFDLAPATPFVGTVLDSKFTITRVVKGRDSFNPIIYGRLMASVSGTTVKIVMTFHPAVWLFIVGWSLVIGGAVVVHFREQGTLQVIPVMLFFSLWVMAVPVFYFDAVRSRLLLKRCLGPNGVPPSGG